MEKIRVGLSMANDWTSPTSVIIGVIVGGLTTNILGSIALGYYVSPFAVPVLFIVEALLYNWYLNDGSAMTDKYLGFSDPAARKRWSNKRIPICTLYELFLEDKVQFNGDVLAILRDHRDEFVNYKLTWSMVKFLVLQIFPNSENSSMKDKDSTKKEIAEHYDRGNDFFNAFLGPRMVYTCGVFHGLDQSLETAQDNKMSLICEKLHMKKGHTMLDIGCGWGTLTRHAAKYFGARSTGVTLSVEGAAWCNEQIKQEGLDGQVDVLCMDYRDIPKDVKFDRISAIEMAEHVGLANFQLFLKNIKFMLKDDGMFLMQVAGLRQGSSWEDVAWGLFMSRYIFPGADASTPLNWYVQQMELAGFEVHSVQNIGKHYSHTLHRWYDNWQQNKAKMEGKYGAHLCRLWDFFLAWSVIASGQGSATCYQLVGHKNTSSFDRNIYTNKAVATASHEAIGVDGK